MDSEAEVATGLFTTTLPMNAAYAYILTALIALLVPGQLETRSVIGESVSTKSLTTQPTTILSGKETIPDAKVETDRDRLEHEAIGRSFARFQPRLRERPLDRQFLLGSDFAESERNWTSNPVAGLKHRTEVLRL